MARLKTKEDRSIRLSQEDYEKLIKDRMMIRALIIAGIEKMPIYNAMQSILNDKNVRIDIIPIR